MPSSLKRNHNWSTDLQSIQSVFNQHLYFDDSTYLIYFNMWECNRPAFEITTGDTLKSVSKLNANLIHLNTLTDKQTNASKLYDLLKHFLSKNPTPNIYSHIDSLNELAIVEDLKCGCETFDEHQTDKDSLLAIRQIYIDAQLAPLRHYVSTLVELKQIHAHPGQLIFENDASSLNFSHLVTKQFKLGKFYSLFKKMSVKCFNFVDLFYEGLKATQQDADEENSDFSNYFRKFANQSASLASPNTTAVSSFIHYNWLDEYLGKMYMCKLNKESSKKTSSYIFSIELVLNLFDRKLLAFNQMNTYLWSNYNFLAQDCTSSSVQASDEHLVVYLKSCIEEFKQKHFGNEDQAFFSYLRQKGFNRDDDLFRLNEKRSSILVEIIVLGCMLAYMFSPIEPMDPLEYKNLIRKTQMDTQELEQSEIMLEKANNAKLKSLPEVIFLLRKAYRISTKK